MFAAEQKSAIASIAKAAKTDLTKGRAARQQRAAFDGLLNCRIRMQKALVTANSLSSSSMAVSNPTRSTGIVEDAEKSTIALLNSLQSLRSSMAVSHASSLGLHAEHLALSIATPIRTIHESLNTSAQWWRTERRNTIDRWAKKTELPSARAGPDRGPKSLSFSTSIATYLGPANLLRLVERSQLPRSCAPLQVAESSASVLSPDSAVYDDADWYAQLLRDLVESRSTAAGSNSMRVPGMGEIQTAHRDAAASAMATKRKRPKPVGPQASKGRKMRYNVHERLQTFMPRQMEPRLGWWEKQRIDELFGSLLGRKVRGGLDEGLESEDEVGDDDRGLRLFRSSS